MTDTKHAHLDEVAALAAELANAQAQLRRAAIEAVDAGCGEVRTSEAARVARRTLRRWLKEATGTPLLRCLILTHVAPLVTPQTLSARDAPDHFSGAHPLR